MMYIEIYFLMQLIILITLIVLYRKDYIAPEVIYSASMVLSSFSYIQLISNIYLAGSFFWLL